MRSCSSSTRMKARGRRWRSDSWSWPRSLPNRRRVMQAQEFRWWTIVLALLWPVAASAQPAKEIDFAHDIVPLLKARCAECHTSGKYKGGVSFDTREALVKSKAVVPGKSGESALVKRITSQDPEMRMPPKGNPLTAKEIALLRAWIDQGVSWEAGFTF